MLLKIDLEKTYDRVSWSFIKDTLIKADFPSDWVRNVMHCIETVRISVSWNGKILGGFKPTRGLRQGDAISPYLCSLYGMTRAFD